MKAIPQIDPEQAFLECEKMLFKLAWAASTKHDLPFSDCLSECSFAFVKAINWRFKPERGAKLSTCVYSIAKWRLHELVLAKRAAHANEEIDEEKLGDAPPLHSPSLELVDDLSNDAKEIIRLLLDTPAEVLGIQPVPVKQLLTKVKAYLIKRRGKRRSDLDKAHQEIKNCFQQAWAV